MMITVELRGQSKAVVITPASIEIPRPGISESLRHQELSVSISAVYEPDLLALTATEEKILVTVKDDGTPVFTGILGTNQSWEDHGHPTPIEKLSLSASDNTYLLERKVQDAIALKETDLASAVARLCAECNVTMEVAPPSVAMEFFVAEAGKRYRDVLDDLLFQHCMTWAFNGAGKMVFFDLAAAADLPPLPLGEDVICAGMSVSQTTHDFSGAKINYNPLAFKADQQVYFEGNGLDGDNNVTPLVLRPGQYYPYESDPQEEQREGRVYQTFEDGYAESYTTGHGEKKYRRSAKTSLLYSENHRLVQDWDAGIEVDRTDWEPLRSSVRFLNTTDSDKNLMQLAIRADAWYRDGDASVTAGSAEGSLYESDAEYLFTSAKAEKLARLCSRFFCGRTFKVSARLHAPVVPGAPYLIDTGTSGVQLTALAVSCDHDPEADLHSAVFLSYGEILVDTARYRETASGNPYDSVIAGLADRLNGLIGGGLDVADPTTPTEVAATAEREGIQLSCVPGNSGLSNMIASYAWEVNKGGRWERLESPEPLYFYPFDRDTDGYPEAADLAPWRFRVKAVNLYGKESGFGGGEQGVAADLSGYLTWLPPHPAAEGVVAKQDGIYTDWRADTSLTWGDVRYRLDITYGEGDTPAEVLAKVGIMASSYTYLFDRSFDKDGYPETASVTQMLHTAGLPLKGRNLSLYRVKISAYTLQRPDAPKSVESDLLTDYYGTWVPAEIQKVNATAGRDSIEIDVTPQLDTTRYGTPYSYIIERRKGSAAGWETQNSASPLFSWPIDRDADGYPEAADLDGWKFRAKAVSTAGHVSPYWGGGEEGDAPDTDNYGTWLLGRPQIVVSVSGRSVTLAMQQPTSATRRERYGTVRHKIQIQKPEESSGWFAPGQNLNPFEREDNWKAGDGEITATDTYTQTMPLTGQTVVTEVVEGQEVRRSSPTDTLYRFKVTAFSEAAESESVEVNATALATGIQDIVAKSITHDKISTPSLAAISANMGVISSGGFSGSALNYWFLSTVMGQLGVADRYEGSMRVGGQDEYLLVEPIVEAGVVKNYRITFKVGSFEISSTASNINGELIVTESADSLDRTRITPFGTYYEHRETPTGTDWRDIARMRTDGIKSGNLYSDQSLIITNTTIAHRRKNGLDIGRPYLSPSGRVWHFDTDLLDQNQAEGLAVTAIGEVLLADQYNTAGSDIDFTPAILAVAPYSEIGRSAYGQFKGEIALESTNTLTVDFWIQYIWSENQTLFDIGNANDRVRLAIANTEPYLNDYRADRDEAPLNQEMLEPGDVIVLNEPAPASSTIQHVGSTVPVPSPEHVRSFEQLGIEFVRNSWLHVGIVLDGSDIAVFLNKTEVRFPRYASAAAPADVMLNEQMVSLILDELYIDTAAAEPFADFAAGTDARIPWAALDRHEKHFILEAENLLTNIFDTDLFRAKVREVMQEAQQ